MNIVKLGGSIINPNGKYDNEVIDEFISVVKNSKEGFIFVVGGGRICRLMVDSCELFIKKALVKDEWIKEARDSVGIASTKINARYVMRRFREELGEDVHDEIILDPTIKVTSKARIFFASGWKPGHSTDNDMMMLAKAYKAKKVFKITNISYVKRISPTEVAKLSEREKKKALEKAEDIKQISWQELNELVGDSWDAGLNTPFDPTAAKLGATLKIELCIGTKKFFLDTIKGKKFIGTVVKEGVYP